MTGRDAVIPGWLRLSLRIVLVVGGGYLLAAGSAGLLATAAAAILPRAEAVMLMAMLVFVIYLVALLWGFHEQRPTRLWTVFGAGGVATFGLSEVIATMGGV